jgi:V/A-type H+-transporting ATPase subunit A
VNGQAGAIRRVAGPVVTATRLAAARLYDVVFVGDAMLPGEVIRLEPGAVVIQVYEDPSGLRAREPVVGSGKPLEVELGPGLLGGILDGIQRPLSALAKDAGEPLARPFLERGFRVPALPRDRSWDFAPTVREGVRVGPGDVLGIVAEGRFEHRVLVPDGVAGTVTAVHEGAAHVEEPIASVDGQPVAMLRRRPVREPTLVAGKLAADVPLVTGQRVIDMFFPLPRGGAATIPGGFGTGKTQLEQALAKWSHADVVVYVACGERGNELSEVLDELPRLVDERTGASLMERTIIVANTSNMPVAAREASIYTGMTIAEYFRDQGYDVALLADSTSRWGEAVREVSSRLEEMPAEEGYPAYLASRLAAFYERAGAAVCRGRDRRRGSITIVGAVSPPGGDFSEPITQYSLRLAGTFWALDTTLARQRHFPAVDWRRSYSLYDLSEWFAAEVEPDWPDQRAWALELLEREGELLEIVQLVGADTLAPREQVILRTGRLLREDFLQQSTFDERDAYCPLEKQYRMLQAIRQAHEVMESAVARGVDVPRVTSAPALAALGRLRVLPADEVDAHARAMAGQLEMELEAP